MDAEQKCIISFELYSIYIYVYTLALVIKPESKSLYFSNKTKKNSVIFSQELNQFKTFLHKKDFLFSFIPSLEFSG